VERRRLADARQFKPEKLVKSSLFETERFFYDLYCLLPGQSQRVHSHGNSDKVYLVMSGKAVVTVGTEEAELGPEEAVLCPAGVPHGVKNDGPDPATLLVVAAPPPV
jgi:mannose-6-phosphate isomerase-like protein (cupin superfamily)